MMKKVVLALLLLLCISPAQGIVEYFHVTSYVTLEKVHEVVQVNILNTANFSLEKIFYLIDAELSNIKVNDSLGGLEFVLRKYGDLEITLREPLEVGRMINITIEYDAVDQISRRNKGYLFLTTRYIQKDTKVFISEFKLPVGMAIEMERRPSPPNATLLTDGERIIVRWEFRNTTQDQALTFYVYFKPQVEYTPSFFPYIILAALLALLIFIVFKFFESKKKYFLKGLSKDERAIVKKLIRRKEEYQSNLRKELGLSRPKMTRIVKLLEEKGIVEKREEGRRNKLIFKF
jgi:uncharacterized membrane protein